MKSFHFEKLQGREPQRSIRLNRQWRLIVELVEEGGRKRVRIVGIERLSLMAQVEQMAEQISPAEGFSPGEFLSEELEARGWSQQEFAEIIGRPANAVSEIINGKRAITPATAKALAAALGTSPALRGSRQVEEFLETRESRSSIQTMTASRRNGSSCRAEIPG